MSLNWEDFNKIFCQGIFKEVLISLVHELNHKKSAPGGDISQDELSGSNQLKLGMKD